MSKPTEYAIPRVDPNVYDGFWVVMICPFIFLKKKEVPFWRVMLLIGADMQVWGRSVSEKSIPSSYYFCKAKTALKKDKF